MVRKLIQRRVPGGKTVQHTKRKKTAKHKCAVCHGLVHGKPRGTTVEIRRMKKTERKPSRPFAGMLCTQCTRKVIDLRAQIKNEDIRPEQVPISLKSYVLGV